MNQLAETLPELIGIKTGVGQGFILNKVIKLGINLKIVALSARCHDLPYKCHIMNNGNS